MLWILIALALLLFYLWRKRGKGGKKAAAARHPLEGWIEESLARELAKKVDLEHDVVIRTLQGAPEPEAVSALEEAVRSVEVRFSRLPDGRDVEVRVEASLEAGGTCTATRRMALAELPAPIRAEFQRTGGAMLFRPWDFPWSRPGAAWAE